VQHDADDAGQDEDIFEDRDHASRKHFIERVDVGSDARDEAADRILVEERDVHMLQVPEDLAAQIEHHLLSGPLHGVGLDELQHKRKYQKPDVQSANLRDANQRSTAQTVTDPGVGVGRLRQILVDGNFGEEGTEHVGHRLEHDRDQRYHYMPFVGTKIREQPPHQPAVIRFPYYLFFLVGRHRAETDLDTRLS